MCHVARKKQNPRHRHCEPYVQRTYIVYTVPMWFLRLFGVSVGSAQAHGLIHRTCPNSRLQDSLALTGTYVRTYKPTTEIQDLPYVRFISTGKFPGLTRKVSGSHSLVRYPVQENSFARKSRKNSTFTMVHGRKQNDQKAKEHNKQQQQQRRRRR